MKKGKPGRRFKDRYYQRRQSDRSVARKALVLGTGIVVVALGIFFIPAPGPGFLIVFVGAGLIAEESLPMARACDWAELKLRSGYAMLARVWTGASSPVVKWLLIFVLAAVAVAVVFVAYWFVTHWLLGTN